MDQTEIVKNQGYKETGSDLTVGKTRLPAVKNKSRVQDKTPILSLQVQVAAHRAVDGNHVNRTGCCLDKISAVNIYSLTYQTLGSLTPVFCHIFLRLTGSKRETTLWLWVTLTANGWV